MKYFILKTSTEAKKTATIAGLEAGFYIPDDPLSQLELSMWEFPKFKPKFCKLVFKRGFRMVDFIYPSTMGSCGFIISERIKNIIRDFNLMPNKLYQLPVYEHKGVFYNYFLLQLVKSHLDYSMIDFEKSKFYKEEREFNKSKREFEWGNNIENLSIKNSEEYGVIIENMKNPFIRIFHRKLVLHKKPKDLFAIHNVVGSNYIISERLKLLLEEMKATGLEDFVKIEIEHNEE